MDMRMNAENRHVKMVMHLDSEVVRMDYSGGQLSSLFYTSNEHVEDRHGGSERVPEGRR
jgi:hypothetical protein